MSDRTRELLISRREMLQRGTRGFGILALAALIEQEAAAAGAAGPRTTGAGPSSTNPLAVRPPHHAARAKRVIFLFMPGGPSHVDLWDPKPRLTQESGQPLPFEKPALMRTRTGNLLRTPFSF